MFPKRRLIPVFAFSFVSLFFQTTRPEAAEGQIDKLPEGPGLAGRFPQDKDIDRDSRVLFAEDFETGQLDDLSKRWSSVSNKDGKILEFDPDVPPGSGGRHSLAMTATLPQNTGGHLYRRLPREVEKAFFRFYVKFAPDADYIHHFVHMGGYRPSTPYPQGGAGERPKGDERFTVGIEPYGSYGSFLPPGAWNFYTYWHEMKGSADGKYWGNGLHPVRPALVPRGRWQCVEVMLKMNSAPNQADGALALWLDGKLTAHFAKDAQRKSWTGMGFSLTDQGGEPFEGFRWRASNELKINFFWLLHYVTENAARQNNAKNSTATNRVWFDQIVAATDYIGPIKTKGAKDEKQ